MYPSSIREEINTYQTNPANGGISEIKNMYGRLVKSGNAERFYTSFYFAVVSNTVILFEGLSRDAATLLSTKVADFILAGSKEKAKDSSICTCAPLTKLSAEEEAGLQYIGGYVLHKLHNKLANSKKSPEIEQAISILKAGKSDDQAVSDSQRLTSSLNRGGLWTITKNTQTIFERAEHYFRDITSKADIRKLDCTDIISRSTHDIDVVSAYHLILSDAELTAESTVAKDVLHNIIQLYVRVRSFSFAKDIIQKHKVQAKQLKSKALRKEISRACKESENDRQS